MAVLVSTRGIDNLVKEINKINGSHIVSANLVNEEWVVLVGDVAVKKAKVIGKVVNYLEGIRDGILACKSN